MNEILAGIFFIFGTIAGLLSVTPVIDSKEYLTQAATNAKQVIKGSIFQLLMAAAYVGFVVFLYFTLSIYNQALAIGFLVSSSIAAAFNIVGIYVMLQILMLSQDYVKSAPSNTSSFRAQGSALQSKRDIVNHVLMVFVQIIGGVLLLYILHQSKLVPSWLIIWGFIGSALAFAASWAVLLRRLSIKTTKYISLNLLLVIQQLVFAVWLIIVGLG